VRLVSSNTPCFCHRCILPCCFCPWHPITSSRGLLAAFGTGLHVAELCCADEYTTTTLACCTSLLHLCACWLVCCRCGCQSPILIPDNAAAATACAAMPE
jgi:hypothetical protein